MMDRNLCKEQFSFAYVRAVAAAAGFHVVRPEVHDDSVDLGILGKAASEAGIPPRIELQAKCTSSDILGNGTLHFALPIKNYDDLRRDCLVPRLLVVVLVPDDPGEWIAQSEEELAMRKCGYWVNLRRYVRSPNQSSVTIEIPREQVFTVSDLRTIMEHVSRQGEV